MTTTEGSYYLSISKEELAQLPQAHFEGSIIVVDKAEEVACAVQRLKESPILGFDTETKPSFKKGQTNKVSLLQLSCGSSCYLFRLNMIGFNEQLIQLLEDESVMKVGASVHDDFHNLNKLAEFNPGGFVDVQKYVKDYHIADNSLARIYGIMFGERMSKNQRLTNWEQAKLTNGQQEYAALDAYACTRIYQSLYKGEFNPEQSPYKHYPESEEKKAE